MEVGSDLWFQTWYILANAALVAGALVGMYVTGLTNRRKTLFFGLLLVIVMPGEFIRAVARTGDPQLVLIVTLGLFAVSFDGTRIFGPRLRGSLRGILPPPDPPPT